MNPFALKFYSPIQTDLVTCEHSFSFVYIFISFQDLYRVLLEAEIRLEFMDDVDMTRSGETDSRPEQ